jgi:8-hydroxy-5-deazaflavin:NADPH oxidoreductase
MDSGAERVAGWVAGACVFKTLNQTGAENMADAGVYHPKPVMFVAGDDAAKKPIVMGLVADLGFEAIDAGPLIAARLLEPFGMLWIELAMQHGQGREFAFAAVRRIADDANAAARPLTRTKV